jgi:hypothetical protein
LPGGISASLEGPGLKIKAVAVQVVAVGHCPAGQNRTVGAEFGGELEGLVHRQEVIFLLQPFGQRRAAVGGPQGAAGNQQQHQQQPGRPETCQSGGSDS